jgi:hypothetical protein
MFVWDGVSVEMLVDPPIVECPVGSNKERLFGWGRLRKSIGYIGTEDKEILCGGDSIE